MSLKLKGHCKEWDLTRYVLRNVTELTGNLHLRSSEGTVRAKELSKVVLRGSLVSMRSPSFRLNLRMVREEPDLRARLGSEVWMRHEVKSRDCC